MFSQVIHQIYPPNSMQMYSYYTLLHFFLPILITRKRSIFGAKILHIFFLLIISAVSVSKLPLIQAKVSSVKITITLEIMEATLSLRFFDFLSTMIIILWLKSHITYGYKHLLLSLFRYL